MWRNESKICQIGRGVLAVTFSAVLLSGCSAISAGMSMFKAGSESETETSSATVTSTSITATTTTSTSSASGCDADKKVEDTELGEFA